MTLPIDIAQIEMACRQIDPVFLRTPLVRQPALDDALGCTFFAKVETLNPIRTFKGRGADFFTTTVLQADDRPVCASVGNFGLGLAHATGRRGLECTVFVASNTSQHKIESLRRAGSLVRIEGRDFDEAKSAARQYSAGTGSRFVEDGAESAIAEGAGTIGVELVEEAPAIDIVLVPLGNGALLAGVGTAMRHLSPRVRIMGVVAEQAPAMKLSLEHRHPIEMESNTTIADGIAIRVPIPEVLPILECLVDEVLAVSEVGMLQAMRLLHKTLGLVVEPSAAVGVAAILADPARFQGRTVATVLTGANVTEAQMQSWLFCHEAK